MESFTLGQFSDEKKNSRLCAVVGLTDVGLSLFMHLKKCRLPVIGYESNRSRMQEIINGQVKVHDKTLSRLLSRPIPQSHLTMDMKQVMETADTIYVTVDAPYQPDDYNAFDVTDIGEVITEISAWLEAVENKSFPDVATTGQQQMRATTTTTSQVAAAADTESVDSTKTKSLVFCSVVSPGFLSVVVEFNLRSLFLEHGFELHYLPLPRDHGTEFSKLQTFPVLILGTRSTFTESPATTAVCEHMVAIAGPSHRREIFHMSVIEAELSMLAQSAMLQTNVWFAKIVRQMCVFTSCRPEKVLGPVLQCASHLHPSELGAGFDKLKDLRFRMMGFKTLLAKNGIDTAFITALEKTDEAFVSFTVEEQATKLKQEHQESLRDDVDENDDTLQLVIENIGSPCAVTCLKHSRKMEIAEEFVNRGWSVVLSDTLDVINVLRTMYGPVFQYIVQPRHDDDDFFAE